VTGSALRPDLTVRMAITAGAVAVWLVALYIPLYGIDQQALAAMIGSGILVPRSLGRLSIGALSVIPIVSALTLAEAVRIFGPRLTAGGPQRGDSAPPWVVWLGLTFAVQAANIAVALEAAGYFRSPLVTEPGLTFRIACVATLTASTALFWWLATQITRHGLGSGVWLLFVALPISDLAHQLPIMSGLFQTGATPIGAMFASLLYPGLAIAAVAFLYRTLGTPDRGEALIWPLLLAQLAVSASLFVLGALSLATSRDLLRPILPWFEPGHPAGLAAMAALVCLFAIQRNRRSATPLSAAQCGLVAGALVAIYLGAELLLQTGAAAVPIGVMLVITTVVMLKLFDTVRGRDT
jgi:hypothetical protein